MATLPLLFLPAPKKTHRSPGPRGASKYHYPTHAEQINRLTPQFDKIVSTINTLQTSPGTDPELVLVIETIGSVTEFIKAVSAIEGLEWLGELEEEDIEPDFDFYDETSKDKQLKGSLYLMMTNEMAIKKILSLWESWKKDPIKKFDRNLAKFKEIFKHLKNIKQWDIENRLFETGILDDWNLDLQTGEECWNKCEIELWFRNDAEIRRHSQATVEALIKDCRGNVISSCIIEEIAYHSLLVELPGEAIQKILTENQNVELIKCHNIMFIRPHGQMMISTEGDLNEGSSTKINQPQQASLGNPIIALLDGYPISNHDFLKNRLVIDDPDEYETDYAAKDRKHGTAMASLIIHGDINETQTLPLDTLLYIRPIMQPSKNQSENLPDTCLIVDLVHRAVRRIFDGEGKTPPQAPQIKIINFSIGDKSRPFINEISPLAKLLDWLSVKYNVLFIISAGNYVDDIDVKTDIDTIKDEAQKSSVIINSLIANALQRRILSPAESINSISVGAANFDYSTYIKQEHDHRFDPVDSFFPSAISPFGGGYRRSIKPEIIFSGGKTLYTRSHKKNKISAITNYAIPGNKVASPSNIGVNLSYTVHTRGTSNAAALTTRAAYQCYKVLEKLLQEHNSINPNQHTAPLLKAMLIHGSSWRNASEKIQNALSEKALNKTQLKQILGKWLGYGLPDISRVLSCTEQRVTLIGTGYINSDEAYEFNIPIPASLEGKKIKRRLIATLAWLSSISPLNQKYRDAKIWFEIEGKNSFSETVGADHHAVRKGTIQHEILEDNKVISDTSALNVKVKVNCKDDTGFLQKTVPYAILVTLEIAEAVDISIYEEIRSTVTTKVPINH